MKRVNVIFDGNLDDTDILSVPDYIADNIEQITQQFFNWVANPQNVKEWTYIDSSGHSVLGVGTQEFVWWLNTYQTRENDRVSICCEHSPFHREYPSADF